jgi:tRNA-splicing ligase RtcB
MVFPIGGVLATDNAVIPYAVGMDIACRMKMTVLDLPMTVLTGQVDRLSNALEAETRFGVGATFRKRREHKVMDEDWSFSPMVSRHKDKAWSQLGTSGSGNHFVEFGTLTLEQDDLGLKAGTYLALLSHSGSRGTGNEIATHFSKLATLMHSELPKELTHLPGGYVQSGRSGILQAMQLMGRYAAANHQLIHQHIAKNLKAKVLLDVETITICLERNASGHEVIVHRKGRPRPRRVLELFPFQGTPAMWFAAKKSCIAELRIAWRRKKNEPQGAKENLTCTTQKIPERSGVLLLSAGLDEVPMAYKDIQEVMVAQHDLVAPVARFDPKIVKMAPAGEAPED